MAVPANVIYFAGYDWLRFSPKSPIRKLPINDKYTPLVAGSVARVVAAIAVSPIEMFRTRMQAAHTSTTSAGHFRETLQGMADMVGNQGYSSLWRGLNLTLWRDVPFSAIYWWGYESGRDIISDFRQNASGRGRDRIDVMAADAYKVKRKSRSRESTTTTFVDSFIAGASSGAVAAFVTTPFDVGKTRQQVVKPGMDSAVATSIRQAALRPEELSMPRFLWHIFKEQGVSGLFKGWSARCLKVAPACAIMISSYEIGKKMASGIHRSEGEEELMAD